MKTNNYLGPYTQPGKPRQNTCVEWYNRAVRHECLDLYIFDSIRGVQDIAINWLWTHSHDRPNIQSKVASVIGALATVALTGMGCVTCQGIFPPSAISVRSMEMTNDE